MTTKLGDEPVHPGSFLDDVATQIDGVVDVSTAIRPERDPVAALQAMAEEETETTMVVMSSHGRGGFSRSVLGSIAERVVTGIDVATVLVGPKFDIGAFAPDGPVVVAHDGKDGPDVGLVAALAATTEGRQVVVANALTAPGGAPQSTPTAEVPERVQQWAELLSGLEFTVQCAAPVGADAAVAINNYAQQLGASYVVAGTHGRSGLRRFALGSTAAALVRDATVPVIVHPSSQT
ncbi:MAG: universal stress protein [Actinomycetota bacterium]|nr:universal stress protein [Actinomycetota bacterium]